VTNQRRKTHFGKQASNGQKVIKYMPRIGNSAAPDNTRAPNEKER